MRRSWRTAPGLRWKRDPARPGGRAIQPHDLAILSGVALATAAISAFLGLGGGITLLAVMLLYLDPLAAIPIHSAVQLFANLSRTAIQRRHVRWELARRYAVLLLPAGLLGALVAKGLPPEPLKAAIGCFVLVATWWPQALLLGTHPEHTDPERRFLWLGGVIGFLGPVLGAVGPLQAPFFLNLGLSRQAIVGTFAMCQTLGHLAKLFLFGAIGFAFAAHLGTIALLAVMVVGGTWAGSQLLERASDRGFTLAYRSVLSLVALRLVLWDALRAI